jgi:hypothetical protein
MSTRHLAFALLSLAACNTTTAREHAELDLDCPAAEIDSVPLAPGPGLGSNTYRDTGCGGLAYYFCDQDGEDCYITGPATRVTGPLSIDGVPFVPGGSNVCNTGYADGFFGVEIDDEAGDSLRLIQDPTDLSSSALFIAADGSRSNDMAQVDLVLSVTPTGRNPSASDISGTAKLLAAPDGAGIVGELQLTACRAPGSL